MPTKDEIKNQLLVFFKKLLKEKDLEKQILIAEEINNYACSVSETVDSYRDDSLEEIHNPCLAMHHWKDGTGYCELNKAKIKKFVKQ